MPIDLLFNGCLGLGFALCARDRVRSGGPFASPAFGLVAIFVGVVLLPMTLYLYLAHPAWSWMYLIDPAGVPGLVLVTLLLAHGGAALGGWYLGARLIRAGKRYEQIAAYGLAGASAVLLLLVSLAWGRIGRYGSYDEFHDGRTLSLVEVKLGYVLVALLVGTAVAAGFVALELMRDSRRVRAR
jgi:hypothetical protein